MSHLQPAEAAQHLIDRVLSPLVLGGTIVPVPYVGHEAAPDVVRAASQLYSPAVSTPIDVQRVRVARRFAPVDTVPPIDGNVWAMLLAYSNLLLATDPEQDSLFSSGRSAEVHQAAVQIIEQVAPVSSSREALGRHTVFSRILQVARLDLAVSWWCGSEYFRGREAPGRILAWPDLRRVHQEHHQVPLVSDNISGEEKFRLSRLTEGVASLLRLTPLTDAVNLPRSAPAFVCSTELLQLLSDPIGQALALRAMRRSGVKAVLSFVQQQCAQLSDPRAVRVVRQLSGELNAWAALQ